MRNIIDEVDRLQKPTMSESPAIWTELPAFVDRGPDYFDGWKPAEPTGDDDMDRMLGEIYADVAVRYARAVRDPGFVAVVMAAIYFKAARGMIRMGETEQAFLNRIARLAYVGSLT